MIGSLRPELQPTDGFRQSRSAEPKNLPWRGETTTGCGPALGTAHTNVRKVLVRPEGMWR